MKDHILFHLLQNENKTKGRPDTIIHGGGNINIIFYLFVLLLQASLRNASRQTPYDDQV